MTKKYYECHVTLLGNPKDIRKDVEDMKWKFSAIDGDPVLGDGIKCYATRQFKGTLDKDVVVEKLIGAAANLSRMGHNVIRRKVELVLYDDRSKDVAFSCDGGCVECHIDDYAG